MDIISLQEAKARGLVRYFTGEPCPHGHIAERRVISSVCTECNKIATRKTRRKILGLPQPTRPPPETCECCGGMPDRHLDLDHDHETGKFRGWICRNCNLGLGKLGDSVEGLEKALSYLRRVMR